MDSLPKTGESSSLPFYAMGVILVAIGFIFRLTRKR
ncbi:LPXTG cell wall anchor domain-containing protein [Paenibacillus segetis]